MSLQPVKISLGRLLLYILLPLVLLLLLLLLSQWVHTADPTPCWCTHTEIYVVVLLGALLNSVKKKKKLWIPFSVHCHCPLPLSTATVHTNTLEPSTNPTSPVTHWNVCCTGVTTHRGLSVTISTRISCQDSQLFRASYHTYLRWAQFYQYGASVGEWKGFKWVAWSCLASCLKKKTVCYCNEQTRHRNTVFPMISWEWMVLNSSRLWALPRPWPRLIGGISSTFAAWTTWVFSLDLGEGLLTIIVCHKLFRWLHLKKHWK